MTATVVPHDGFAFGAFTIIAIVVVIVVILGYRIARGEPKTHRTRLGVFVERDRFDDDPQPPDDTAKREAGDERWP